MKTRHGAGWLCALSMSFLALGSASLHGQVVSTWAGSQGNWSDASNWMPTGVPNSASADVYLNGAPFAEVTDDGNYQVGRIALQSLVPLTIADGKTLTVTAGSFAGSGTLTNNDTLTLQSVGTTTELRFDGDLSIDGQGGSATTRYPGTITLTDGAGAINRIAANTPGGRVTFGQYQRLMGGGFIGLGQTNITNNGTLAAAMANFSVASTLPLIIEPGNGSGGGELINNGALQAYEGKELRLSGASGGKFTNNGTFLVSGPFNSGASMLTITAGALTNLSGTTLTGGTYNVEGSFGSAILTFGGGNIATNRASVLISGASAVFNEINALADNEGSFRLEGKSLTTAGNLTNGGNLTVASAAALQVSGNLTQTASGIFASNAATTATAMSLDGTITPTVDTRPGTMQLNGSVAFASSATLVFDLGNCDLSGDLITVNGALTLAGTLDFGSLPGKTGSYRLINYSGGSLTDQTLHVGSLPPGTTATVDTSTAGEVNLNVTVEPSNVNGAYEAIIASPGQTPCPCDPVVVFPDAKNHPSQQKSLTCNLPPDAYPGGAAFIGGGVALLADRYNPRLFVVDVSTAALLDTIDTTSVGGANYHIGVGGVTVAPGFAAALIVANNQLGVIHAPFSSSSSVTSVALPQGSFGGSILFDGTARAYIYLPGVGISVSDPPYNSIAFTIPLTTSGSVAVSPDGSALLVTDQTSNQIAIYTGPLSASTTPATLTLPAAFRLSAVAVTPDGTAALVASSSDNQVFAVHAPFSSSSTVESLPLPPRPDSFGFGVGFYTITISPDGQFALLGGATSLALGYGPLVNLRAPFTAAGVQVSTSNYQTSEAPLITFAPVVGASALRNISTRLAVQTGDNVLIGGFIVTGTQPKKVIVRGLGPSLPVSNALADPYLELHDGTGALLLANDNWMDASNEQEIIDSTIAPSNNLESAILTTLPANSSAYTAIVQGVNGTTGVGLVEVYDLDSAADSKLANISTRGLVQTGDNVLIGGFILVGANSEKVIVRAIGPSLPVAGALADPTLEIHNGNGTLLAANDNWRSDQEADIIASGVPPQNDLESALVETLSPGNYTAIVRGANDGTGVGLVEVYSLQ